MLAELKEKRTFETLLFAVDEEKKKKAHLLDIIIRLHNTALSIPEYCLADIGIN